MSVSVAVLGAAGLRGRQLLKLFYENESSNVRVAVDKNYDKLQEVKNPINGFKYCSYLYDVEHAIEAEVDAVVIATPDYLHEEHACAALKAGKHVFLEKPLALTPEGCERIIATAKEMGRIVYVGHNLRHFTVIKKLKELVGSGAVGAVKAIWCRHFVSYGRSAYFEDWHRYRKNIGSLLIHKGSHDLDVIQWLGGGRAIRAVAMGTLAMWDKMGADTEDILAAVFKFDNGVQATYSQCHFADFTAREYSILGTDGTLLNIGDNPGRAVVQLFKRRAWSRTHAPTEEFRFVAEEGFHGDADKRIVTEFIGVIEGTTQPTISPAEAMWAVKAGYAATQSLRNGSVPVDVV